MCGICGKLYFDAAREISAPELKSMTESLRHRGPDDEGFHINNNVGLGFRRLSIIDLNTGHQPLSNEDGSIWIVFNGEIYNYRQLRTMLEGKGHVFRTSTDTETIVHLYEEFGERCVAHLRGMFAFAIWNQRQRTLFCARDRFGMKPFYYYLDNEKFVFASEMKAILRSEDIQRTIDPLAVDSYFAYGYIGDEKSIYKGIRKLEPAQTLTVDQSKPGRSNISKYWEIHFEPDYVRTEEQWLEELDHVLSESVKMHLVSDVPLGVFLSGGIDSSAILALMSKFCTEPIKTFTIGFRDPGFNELRYAAEVAGKFKTEHHERIVEPESVDLLPRIIRAYDEPFADSSAIPTYYVSQLAREHVTVVLSGDGADELFAGYEDYAKLKTINDYHIAPHAVNKLLWRFLHTIIPHRVKGKGFSYLLSKKRGTAGAFIALWDQTERRKLYSDALWRITDGVRPEELKVRLIQESSAVEFVSRMLELDLKTSLANDILTKVDIASMQHSLEVRPPILDHEFAELSFRIPAGFKLRTGSQKYILRKSIEKHFPASIANRKKQGFAVPIEKWFKSDLKEYVEGHLLASQSPLWEFVNRSYVKAIVHEHQRGMRNFSHKIWSLLVFAEWLEQNRRHLPVVGLSFLASSIGLVV